MNKKPHHKNNQQRKAERVQKEKNPPEQTDSVLTEDAEFPSFTSKKDETDESLFTEAERKKKEMKNNALGGF